MRGTGELEGGQIEEVMFEGYGPGGAAVLVNVATDNRNRTVSEIRHTFSKNGGNMGEQGSVAWMFERKSQIFVPSDKAGEDQLLNIVLDAGGRRSAQRRRPVGDPLRAGGARCGFKGARSQRHSAGRGEHRLGAQEPGPAGRQERQHHAEAERGTGRPRRRAERLFQLRYRREGAGGAGAITCACSASIAAPQRTGYGVIESDGVGHRLLAAGVIRTQPRSPSRSGCSRLRPGCGR